MSDLAEQLYSAAQNGDVPGLQAALAAGADVHYADDYALQMAAFYGHAAVVEYLLAAGANVHADEDSALRLAVERGATAVIQILTNAGADVQAKDNYALHVAADGGQDESVRCLVAAGANVHSDANYALRTASERGYAEIVGILRNSGADLSAIINQLHTFSPDVQVAALNEGKAPQVNVVSLAAQGVCLDALCVVLRRQQKSGIAAMLRTTQMLDHLPPAERAEQLLTLLEQYDLGKRLLNAAQTGDLTGVQAALAAGANVHTRGDDSLLMAASKGHREIVECLLAAGANVHANGDYAVRWACAHGHLAVAKVLLAAGANIHARDDLALRWAARHGARRAVEYLLASGADIHAGDEGALYSAAESGHPMIVLTLRKRGARLQPGRPALAVFSVSVQMAALAAGDLHALQLGVMARQGVSPEALCVLIARHGHASLAAMLRATRMLATMDPVARAETLAGLLNSETRRTRRND